MTLAQVKASTVIDPLFSAADKTTIEGVIEQAYNGSAVARGMLDTFVAAGGMLTINFLAGAFQARPALDRLELDMAQLNNATYIDLDGKAVVDTPTTAILHEMTHAIQNISDNWTKTDYKGDNVTFVNTIYKELGLPEQVSYIAYDTTGQFKLGYEYSEGASIDTAVRVGTDWDSSVNASGTAVSRSDLLIGNAAANTLITGGGTDYLMGQGGDDRLFGGNGSDIAIYTGTALDYDIRKNADGTWSVRHARGAMDEGSDTLNAIEKVRFGDDAKYDLKKKGLTFQTDFALVIDTTGSMGDDIASVRAQGSALIDAAFANGRADARIGIVTFKDTTIGEPSSVVLPFTEQDVFADRKAAALAALGSIGVGGGGDLPETAFDGLIKALNGTMGQWREGAGTSRIALFTDAAVKDIGLFGQVVALALNVGASLVATSRAIGERGSVDTFEFALPAADAMSRTEDDIAYGETVTEPTDPIPPDTTTKRIEIYTILTGSGSGVATGGLEDVSAATGGAFFRAPSNELLVETLLRIINLPAVAKNEQDFNGDGKADIVWQNRDGSVAIWVLEDDKYVFAGPSGVGSPGGDWRVLGTADFNGDGDADIFWQKTDGTPAIWLMDGTELLAGRPVGPGTPGPGWMIRDARDMTGDSKADFIWQNTADGSVVIWEMDGLDLKAAIGVGPGSPGKEWAVVASGDFNGDGDTDLVWQKDDGTAAVWLLDGPALIAGRPVGPGSPGADWKVRATGDFDGDGKADILWQKQDGTAAIWLMDGLDLVAGAPVGPASPGSQWIVQGAGDANADGKSDILWQNRDGTAAVWLMDGLTLVSGGPIGPGNPGPDWLVSV